MSDISHLEEQVKESAKHIERVDWDPGAKSVWLRFDEKQQDENLNRILTLLSGFYTSRTLEKPFSRLSNLRLEPTKNHARLGYPKERVEYVLVSDFPKDGHGNTGNFCLCYITIAYVGNQRFDYMVAFSRRRNNLSMPLHLDMGLSVKEASKFYTYAESHRVQLFGMPHQSPPPLTSYR